MNRPATRRTLAVLVTGVAVLLGVPVATLPAAQGSAPVSTPDQDPADEDPAGNDPADEVPQDPLKVVIHRITPGAVPSKGAVTVSGEIRNRSTVEWSDLNVYLVTSAEPITSKAELAAAAQLDPSVQVGSRIVEPGLFVQVPDLSPGRSTAFRLSVPADRLGISGAPGVYWLGVQVLGEADGGRAEGADGQARLFLPLVPPRTEDIELALGVQLRNHTVRASDGRLEFIDGWRATFGSGGRLGRLLDLAGTAGDFPLTWIVDPAVLEAARSVAAGNPAMELDAPAPDQDATAADDPVGATGATSDPEPAEPDGPADEGSPGTTSAEAASALAWLEQFSQQAADRPVLALPYADLDITAAFHLGSEELVDLALALSEQLLERLSLTSDPVLVPPSGLMPSAAVTQIEPDVPLVLAPMAVEDAVAASAGPVLDRPDGGRVALTPTNQALFGPRPGTPRSALAVRQRLLADAALHALSPEQEEPMLRLLPYGWDPGGEWEQARFFRGLELPWLSGTSFSGALTATGDTGTSTELDPAADLRYPDAEGDAELPYANLAATEALIDDGARLEKLLTDNTVIDDELTRQALLTASLWSRKRPGVAAARARGASDLVESWLDRVSVRGVSFVTMSSEEGSFQVTLVNGLDEPVTVGLRAEVSDETLKLTVPDAVELPPRGRGPMRIDATASDIGVHLVTLQPVTADGTAVGDSTRLSIRSSNVGFILWVIMAVGGAALFAMIAFRIVRRIAHRRRTHGPLLKAGSAG